jgi:hypothetical protein
VTECFHVISVFVVLDVGTRRIVHLECDQASDSGLAGCENWPGLLVLADVREAGVISVR